MTEGVNMIALTKDGERFVFLYDDASPSALLRTFGQYAADPELNFSWYDAAVLSQRVRAAQQYSGGFDSVEECDADILKLDDSSRRDDDQPRRRAA